MRPQVDDSAWPIVRITYGERLSLDEIAELALLLRQIFERRGPMITVSDLRRINPLEATALVRKQVAFEVDNLDEVGAFLAEAIVVPSPLLRALFAAYNFARRRSSFPSEAFEDVGSAMAWAERQAAASRRDPSS